jgi:hypothetical protein
MFAIFNLWVFCWLINAGEYVEWRNLRVHIRFEEKGNGKPFLVVPLIG